MKFLKIICVLITILVIGLVIYNLIDKQYIDVFSKSDNVKYKVLVDVEESKMYVFENEICIKIYTVSGGKQSTPSPIGTWKIVSKGKWGEGFGGSWMGLNVPWGRFGIHGTTQEGSIGWASSHGCIRMENSEVAELYKILPYDTEVIIVDGVYGPFGKGFRYLKSGMYGSDVYEIQKRLKELGFFMSNPNGKFGSETEEAIKRYCKANNLSLRKTIDIELQKHMGFELID